MLANLTLPSPDGLVLRVAAVLLGALCLAALAVWLCDRRSARGQPRSDLDAVPQPVPETDPSPRHILGREAEWLASLNTESNLIWSGPVSDGPIVGCLWRSLCQLAEVLPLHLFRVEIPDDLTELRVEEAAFSTALSALVLHGAQCGRKHLVEVTQLAPEHPHYRRSPSPQIIVHVLTEVERGAPWGHLADQAIEVCRRAGGEGSREADRNLWMIWPTTHAAPSPKSPEPPPNAAPLEVNRLGVGSASRQFPTATPPIAAW